MSAGYRVGQGSLVDQPAAGGVDDDHPGLGFRQRVLVDETRCLRRFGQMHRDEVGTGQQLVERKQLDTQLGGACRRHVRVVGHDVGLESG